MTELAHRVAQVQAELRERAALSRAMWAELNARREREYSRFLEQGYRHEHPASHVALWVFIAAVFVLCAVAWARMQMGPAVFVMPGRLA